MTVKQAEADLAKLFYTIGWDWKKFEDKRICPRCKHLLYRVDNRPYDGIAVIYGRTIPIEVKQDKFRFMFSDLKEHQRDGLLEWERKHLSKAWIFLELGTDRTNSKSSKRRRAWLVPINTLLSIETLCEVYGLKSLPLDKSTTNRKDVLKSKIYATQLLSQWELPWEKGGWTLPKNHMFYKLYIKSEEGAGI